MIRFATIAPRPDPYPDPTAGLHTWPPPGPMPRPRVLLINEDADGTASLYGYAADGTFAGDTWNQSIADAESQAAHDHGPNLSPWRDSASNDLNEAIVAALRAAVNEP